MAVIRRAAASDLDAVAAIYEKIHRAEAAGEASVGWQAGVYPVRATAEAALERGELFTAEENGRILGSAILNHAQLDSYIGAPWEYPADDAAVLVMHTLTVDPEHPRRGVGKAFTAFYEQYARELGCTALRIDTQEKNTRARAMYRGMGFREIAVVPCEFNGIPGVSLVLLEKPV